MKKHIILLVITILLSLSPVATATDVSLDGAFEKGIVLANQVRFDSFDIKNLMNVHVALDTLGYLAERYYFQRLEFLDIVNLEGIRGEASASLLRLDIGFLNAPHMDLPEGKFSRFTVKYSGYEVACLVIHEFGHVLTEFLWVEAYLEDASFREKHRLVESCFDTAKESRDIEKISAYAETNIQEFFAECFVIYIMGQEELPEYLVRMIETVLADRMKQSPLLTPISKETGAFY